MTTVESIIKLNDEEKTDLIIMLNLRLRDRSLDKNYKKRLNNIFKQLCGHDHESMDNYNEARLESESIMSDRKVKNLLISSCALINDIESLKVPENPENEDNVSFWIAKMRNELLEIVIKIIQEAK